MKKLLLMVFVVGFGMVARAQLALGGDHDVLVRSFRLPESVSMDREEFIKIAEEQLCGNYYVHVVDGKNTLVKTKGLVESCNMVVRWATKEAESIPTKANLEIIEAVAEGVYRVTIVKETNSPKAYVKVPEGMSFEPRDLVPCGILPENRYSFKVTVPIGYSTYRMLPEEEANAWRMASAKDLYYAYKAGVATFLVKLPTHKVECKVCEGSGVNQAKYNQMVQSIKNQKQSRRKMLSSDSTRTQLKKLSQNKPKCERCKGKRVFTYYEYHKLDVNAE
ncbi:MAG: hypothetical protein Q4F99_05870 [bacterium]|nr:hypothetical protein [bacterium]